MDAKVISSESSFSFANTTASANDIQTGVNLGLVTNYAVAAPEKEEIKVNGKNQTKKKSKELEVQLNNTTAALDQPEKITYRFKNLQEVYSMVPVKFPAPNRSAVKYNVRLDTILREELSNGMIIDHPIAMSLTVDHELTSAITEEVLDEVYRRLMGAVYNETAKSTRFMAFARGSLQPTQN